MKAVRGEGLDIEGTWAEQAANGAPLKNARLRKGIAGEGERAGPVSGHARRSVRGARRLFLGLGPEDVVGAVEGDEHEAGGVGLAGEPVHGFAGHHGEAGGAESFFGHAVHAGEEIAADDEELFFGGVGVGGNDAAGSGFEKERGWAGIGIAALPGDFETRGFAIGSERGTGERCDHSVMRGLALR